MVSAIVFSFLLVNCGGVIPSSGEMVPRAYMPVKQGKDVGKALNSGLFDKKSPILCDFYAKSFASQNKFITFELRSSSSLQGIVKASVASALASSVGYGVILIQLVYG